jgi:hypothetical protein
VAITIQSKILPLGQLLQNEPHLRLHTLRLARNGHFNWAEFVAINGGVGLEDGSGIVPVAGVWPDEAFFLARTERANGDGVEAPWIFGCLTRNVGVSIEFPDLAIGPVVVASVSASWVFNKVEIDLPVGTWHRFQVTLIIESSPVISWMVWGERPLIAADLLPTPSAPVVDVAPVIFGDLDVGDTLYCWPGEWLAEPRPSYAYQWYDSTDTPISGATAFDFTLTSAQAGLSVYCVVTASNGVLPDASEPSNTLGPVASSGTAPANTVAPVASGTVRVGESLSCTTGTWTGTPTPTYAYQWRRDGADIGGATSSTYTVVTADMDAEIDCVVTATNGVLPDASEPSNALESVWRDILTILGSDGYLWVFDPAETGVSAGSPLASVTDITGVQPLEQPTSTNQPTQQAGRAEFSTDDWLSADALSSYFNSGARSVMVVLQTAISSSAQIVFSATRVGFSSPQWSISAQGRVITTSGGVLYVAATLPASKPVWVVDDAAGSERQIDATVVPTGPAGSSALISGVTLGARRLGSPAAYLTNGVRCLIVANRVITGTERATIRTVLNAQGVTTP